MIEQLDALQRQIHDLIYKVMETETNFSDHGLAKESRGMADIVNKLHEIDNNIEAEMDRLNTPGESGVAYNRCHRCGRPRGYLRRFGVCRICFHWNQ